MPTKFKKTVIDVALSFVLVRMRGLCMSTLLSCPHFISGVIFLSILKGSRKQTNKLMSLVLFVLLPFPHLKSLPQSRRDFIIVALAGLASKLAKLQWSSPIHVLSHPGVAVGGGAEDRKNRRKKRENLHLIFSSLPFT